jgi:FixJ family two-component response regulator
MRAQLDLTALSTKRHGVATVAIVEDDRDLQQALATLLMAHGFRTSAFFDAESFLAFARRSEIDCVILDVRLPGMTGVEAQRRLAEEGTRLPLVFVSAHEDGSVHDGVMHAGAIAFLKKPVSGRRLMKALETALTPGSAS